MNEMVKCTEVTCTNTICIHKLPHKHLDNLCNITCPTYPNARCINVNKGEVEPKVIPHNKSCEFHGQNIETEVLDAWVHHKSNVIELRCIDICKQCGEIYGSVYAIFADKFVKEV